MNTYAMALLMLLGAAAVQASRAPACKKQCTNRYGLIICCDNVPPNEALRCPPMPRILVDCSDPSIVVKDIKAKKCKSDKVCGPEEKCCPDTCDIDSMICMPGQRNLHFLFP